jgi:hypothetical protein
MERSFQGRLFMAIKLGSNMLRKWGGLFISGETKYFENYDEALEWVIAPKI